MPKAWPEWSWMPDGDEEHFWMSAWTNVSYKPTGIFNAGADIQLGIYSAVRLQGHGTVIVYTHAFKPYACFLPRMGQTYWEGGFAPQFNSTETFFSRTFNYATRPLTPLAPSFPNPDSFYYRTNLGPTRSQPRCRAWLNPSCPS